MFYSQITLIYTQTLAIVFFRLITEDSRKEKNIVNMCQKLYI